MVRTILRKQSDARAIGRIDYTKQKAIEIFDYVALMLAQGVYIEPRIKKEMIKEIEFMIDTD